MAKASTIHNCMGIEGGKRRCIPAVTRSSGNDRGKTLILPNRGKGTRQQLGHVQRRNNDPLWRVEFLGGKKHSTFRFGKSFCICLGRET